MDSNIPTHDQFGRPLIIDGSFPNGRLSCQSAFELAVSTTDARGLFDALGTTAHLWGGPWADEFSGMSPDLRALRLCELVVWSVTYPGSFVEHQAFADYGLAFAGWLHEHGAARAATYVAELLAIYPDGTPMPDADARAEYISDFESEHPDRLEEIGNRYLDIATDLAGPIRHLLRERGEELARECESLRTEYAPPVPLSLTEILAIADDVTFTRSLVRWLDAPKGRPILGFERQPAVGQMIWVLVALATSVEVDGMTHFLNSAGIGAEFTKLAAWANTIDAPATVAYVTGATAQLKRLNGGTLPPMEDTARIAAVQKLEEKDEVSGGAGLFDALDEEYAAAVLEELPRRIHAYVTQRRAEIERVVMENAASFSK